MKAKLILISGEGELADVPLLLPVILGRSRRAGLLVQQSLVSRQHCELFEQDGRLMIRDLGSMNGTRVNQVKIDEPTELLSGDLLTVGAVTFRVDCGDNRGTLTDAKDETAVALRSDLDQLLKIPDSDSLIADAPTDESLIANEPEDSNHFAVVPATVTQQSPPDALSSNLTEVPQREPENRPDAFLRNPR